MARYNVPGPGLIAIPALAAGVIMSNEMNRPDSPAYIGSGGGLDDIARANRGADVRILIAEAKELGIEPGLIDGALTQIGDPTRTHAFKVRALQTLINDAYGKIAAAKRAGLSDEQIVAAKSYSELARMTTDAINNATGEQLARDCGIPKKDVIAALTSKDPRALKRIADLIKQNRRVNAAPITRPIEVGTDKPPHTGATPNSIHVRTTKDGRAVQSTIYNEKGESIGHIDWKDREGHIFTTPGQPGTGHVKGQPHKIPLDTIPDDWKQLPPGVTPVPPRR